MNAWENYFIWIIAYIEHDTRTYTQSHTYTQRLNNTHTQAFAAIIVHWKSKNKNLNGISAHRCTVCDNGIRSDLALTLLGGKAENATHLGWIGFVNKSESVGNCAHLPIVNIVLKSMDLRGNLKPVSSHIQYMHTCCNRSIDLPPPHFTSDNILANDKEEKKNQNTHNSAQ